VIAVLQADPSGDAQGSSSAVEVGGVTKEHRAGIFIDPEVDPR
jgi:hypothetical protein